MRGGTKAALSLPVRAADSFLKLDWSVVGNNRPATFAVAVALTLASVTALFLNAKSESNLLDVFFKPSSDMYQAFDRVDAEFRVHPHRVTRKRKKYRRKSLRN